jgi:GDP-L-fucose synthase
VLPALLRKFHEAKLLKQEQVTIWGSGLPMREFMHADDMADASVFLMEVYHEAGLINVGTGVDISIRDLAFLIKDIVGFAGSLVFDTGKPDGTLRKLLDVSKLQQLGWKYRYNLETGIRNVYQSHFPKSFTIKEQKQP